MHVAHNCGKICSNFSEENRLQFAARLDPFTAHLDRLTYETVYDAFRDVGSETQRLEFKQDLNPEELARQAVAMANGSGASLLWVLLIRARACHWSQSSLAARSTSRPEDGCSAGFNRAPIRVSRSTRPVSYRPKENGPFCSAPPQALRRLTNTLAIAAASLFDAEQRSLE